jgi:hypothetical protein
LLSNSNNILQASPIGVDIAGTSGGFISNIFFNNNADIASGSRVTSISNLGAASLAIGNGTAGDTTGTLSLGTLSFPSGTSANQLIKWDGLTTSSGFAGLEWDVAGSWASRLRVAPVGGTFGGRACSSGDLVYFNNSSGSEVFAWKVGIGGSMSLAGALAANGMQLTNGTASNYVSSFVAFGGFTGGAIADAIAFDTFERDGNATPVRLSITGDTAASGAGIANVRLDNSRLMLAVNTGGIVWTDGVSTTVAQTGITQLGAASLAIGNGTVADKSGALSLSRINAFSGDLAGSVTSAATTTATKVVVAVGGTTGTFTVTSTEGFTVGDTVTLSAGGWTGGSGLASTTCTVTTITGGVTLLLTYVSGGPWVAGTYTAQTGTLLQTGVTSVTVTYVVAYTNTPFVTVTPTSNCGAWYVSAQSTAGFTITYATSGTMTFNYHVIGNQS